MISSRYIPILNIDFQMTLIFIIQFSGRTNYCHISAWCKCLDVRSSWCFRHENYIFQVLKKSFGYLILGLHNHLQEGAKVPLTWNVFSDSYLTCLMSDMLLTVWCTLCHLNWRPMIIYFCFPLNFLVTIVLYLYIYIYFRLFCKFFVFHFLPNFSQVFLEMVEFVRSFSSVSSLLFNFWMPLIKQFHQHS